MPQQVYTLDKYEVQLPSHPPCGQSSHHPHFPDGETEAQRHVPNAPGCGRGSADGTGSLSEGSPPARPAANVLWEAGRWSCRSPDIWRSLMLRKPKTQPWLKGRRCTRRPRSAQGTEGWARRAGGSGRRDRPPGHHPRPCPRAATMAASLAHLDAVLLQVQVPCVDGDAGRDFCQLSPGADYPTGLVAAGAGRRAGGGRRGAPSGSRCQGHTSPAGPQGRGEEPEEQQGPMGPGHPTGRQWGAQGAAGARHPQCSCSAWAPGGCGVGGEKKRLSEGRDLPLQKPSSSPKSRQLSAAAATQGSGPKGRGHPRSQG